MCRPTHKCWRPAVSSKCRKHIAYGVSHRVGIRAGKQQCNRLRRVLRDVYGNGIWIDCVPNGCRFAVLGETLTLEGCVTPPVPPPLVCFRSVSPLQPAIEKKVLESED